MTNLNANFEDLEEIKNKINMDKSYINTLSSFFRMILMVLIASILLIACHTKSPEEIREERFNKAEEKIEALGGKIMGYHETNDKLLMVYSQENTLYHWDVDSLPQKLYEHPEQLFVIQYNLDFTPKGLEVKTTKRTITDIPDGTAYDYEIEDIIPSKATDVFKIVSFENRYRVMGPWIFIGGDYVANIHRPNELLDISYLGLSDKIKSNTFNTIGEISDLNIEIPEKSYRRRDYPFVHTKSNDSDVWTGEIDKKEDTFSGENDLQLTLYGENHQLPGFQSFQSEYSDWDWATPRMKGSEDPYRDDYHFYALINLSGYNTTTLETPVIGEFHWRNEKISPSVATSKGLQKYYAKRKADLPELIEEERIKAEQENITRIKNQAVSFWDLAEAYEGNTNYGINKYPKGRKYILYVDFDQILRSNEPRYNYRLVCSRILKDGYFYTNDEFFINQKFPSTGYVECYFDSYSKDYVMFSDEVAKYKFYFTDVKPLLW